MRGGSSSSSRPLLMVTTTADAPTTFRLPLSPTTLPTSRTYLSTHEQYHDHSNHNLLAAVSSSSTTRRTCRCFSSSSSRSYSATSTPIINPTPFREVQEQNNHVNNNEVQISPTLDSADLPDNRDAAQRMIQAPVGTFTPETWFEAEELLPWWSVARTPESVYVFFQLWERLLAEQQQLVKHHDNDASVAVCVDPEMLNRILNNWRVVWWEHDMEGYSPEQVLKRLEQYNTMNQKKSLPTDNMDSAVYRHLVTEKSIYQVLEAAIRRGGTSHHPEKIPEFAERCLETCISFWQNGNESCRPSTYLFNLVIRAFVQSSQYYHQDNFNNNDVMMMANNNNASSRRKDSDDDFHQYLLPAEMTPSKVDTRMSLMTEFQVRFSARTYNLAIQAWANTESIQGAQNAEALLQRMYAEYQQGDIDVNDSSCQSATSSST
jgi:hypothetical protein